MFLRGISKFVVRIESYEDPVEHYLISLCNVWRLKKGLYFLISSFSGWVFLFLVVVYLDGEAPSFLASVHSIVTISRAMISPYP